MMAKPKTFVRTYTEADIVNPSVPRLRVVHNLGRQAPHVAVYRPMSDANSPGMEFPAKVAILIDNNTLELADVVGIGQSGTVAPFVVVVRVTA
jgi:hypothetical protein